MLITPSVINFPPYKKYAALPPAVLLNYSHVGQTIGINYCPAWLEVYDITPTSLKVKLAAGANALTAGDYTAEVILVININEDSQDPYAPVTLIYPSFTVNVTIEDTVVLMVNPPNADFYFPLGATPPINKTFTVTAETNWTVTKNDAWVLLPTTAGSNSGTFQIGVNVTGMAIGIYYDTVTVSDGVNSKTIAVSLTISDVNTGTDYLYINPLLVKFGYSSGGTVPPQKTIELNASEAWTAITNQPWVNLTMALGAAGAAIVPIALQAISALAIGDHFASVTFTAGTIKKTVTVQLTVYEFITQLLTPGELYFCDDENYIRASSGRLDTFLKLEFTSLYKSKSYSMPAEIPYFKGVAEKRIGQRPKIIIGKQSFLNYAEPALVVPYPLVNLNLTITELELFTKNIVQTQSLNNLKFIKGEKPLDNWISDLPRKVYLTKNATLQFSILTNNIAANKINVTGAVTAVFNFAATNSEFLTVVLPLASVGVLNVGDVITVEVLGETIDVEIKDDNKTPSVIHWENKWGVWDQFEFTGSVNITPGYERKEATFRKTELKSETKIINVTKPVDYSINTGWIHSQAEVETLDKLLDAKNMYLFVKNQIIQVLPTTKKLLLFDTDRDLREFVLTFKNAIE